MYSVNYITNIFRSKKRNKLMTPTESTSLSQSVQTPGEVLLEKGIQEQTRLELARKEREVAIANLARMRLHYAERAEKNYPDRNFSNNTIVAPSVTKAEHKRELTRPTPSKHGYYFLEISHSDKKGKPLTNVYPIFTENKEKNERKNANESFSWSTVSADGTVHGLNIPRTKGVDYAQISEEALVKCTLQTASERINSGLNKRILGRRFPIVNGLVGADGEPETISMGETDANGKNIKMAIIFISEGDEVSVIDEVTSKLIVTLKSIKPIGQQI